MGIWQQTQGYEHPSIINGMNPFSTLQSRYLVLGAYLVSSVAVGLGYAYLSRYQLLPWRWEDPLSLPVLSMATWIAVVSTIAWVGHEYGLRLTYVFGQRWPKFSGLYAMVLVLSLLLFSMGSFSVVFYLVSLVSPAYAAQMLETDLTLIGSDSQYPRLYEAATLFLLVVYAPVVEELVFRGFLLQRWGTKWGLRWGLGTSSVAFGLLHFNNPLGLTLFGLVMGLLYVRSQSLWVPIGCHALNNLAVVILDRFSRLGAGEATDGVTMATIQDRWWMGIILIVISTPLIWRFVWRSWPQPSDDIPYVMNGGMN